MNCSLPHVNFRLGEIVSSSDALSVAIFEDSLQRMSSVVENLVAVVAVAAVRAVTVVVVHVGTRGRRSLLAQFSSSSSTISHSCNVVCSAMWSRYRPHTLWSKR